MGPSFDRCILIVLDSLGVGAAPDASRFKDESAHTMGHISQWCKMHFPKFRLPHLSRWGLGQLSSGFGLEDRQSFDAVVAKLKELSPGKDTTTGHWEMAGTILHKEFPIYPNGFPADLVQDWVTRNHLPGYLGNKPASGTTILDELGLEHIQSGKPIVYTSGDSVFQIAVHEAHFGLQRLYDICVSARTLLDPLGIGRVIARPFIGERSGEFRRTENRRDFSMPPPEPNMLDIIKSSGAFVAGVGKIEDIFCHRGLTHVDHTGRNETSLDATLKMMTELKDRRGLIFTNLIDFDQLHGHRRNPHSYAEALMAFDQFLPRLESAMSDRDLMILTADHGNDPTHHGSDHTREYVPLLAWTPRMKSGRGLNLGTQDGFTTIARLVIDALGLDSHLERLPDAQHASAILPTLLSQIPHGGKSSTSRTS